MSLHVGIATQTPLLKFGGVGPGASSAPFAGPSSPVEGHGALLTHAAPSTVELSPGGVARMVLPEVREWAHTEWLRRADWFSLQSAGPSQYEWNGLPLRLHRLTLPKEELEAYARTKEALWNAIHGLGSGDRFHADDFRFYARYNAFTCDALLRECPDVDVAYVHDFQLLQMGSLVGLAAPAVFRWHVPFVPALIPPYVRHFLLRTMEDFDAVIVSTRRDLEGLQNAGFRGRVRQIYPAIDPRDWTDPTPSEIASSDARWGLEPDDEVALCVARMDPIKRQDLAIRAFARTVRARPSAKLLLVGNGSFSGSSGGLGLGKSAEWRQRLEQLARTLGVRDHVQFTGFLGGRDLGALYARANAVVLPSDVEGFGITLLEAWRFGKPFLVSTGAGASEVVSEGLSGHRFPAGDEEALAERLKDVLAHTEHQEQLGRAGRIALKDHDVRNAAPRLARVIDEAIETFGGA